MRPDSAFEPRAAARKILRQSRTGALATLEAGGAPFASLVTVATESDGAPVMLLSDLAVHTANLKRDARASLLLEERAPGDPLTGSRISLTGTVTRYDAVPEATRRRFLDRQPGARGYAGFRDFAFWRMQVEAAHLVAGFGRIVTVSGADLLLPAAAAAPLAEAETDILQHMNDDHADALQLYATRLLGLPAGAWRAVGVDADGLDLGHVMDNDLQLRRLAFVEQIPNLGMLRAALKELADKARNAAGI